jgi:hypothetical protein
MDATAVQWVQLFSTIVFGASAATIAYMQWLINRNKLRIDLFRHRYEVYSKTADFLRATNSNAVEGVQLNDFNSAIVRAKFLFPDLALRARKRAASAKLKLTLESYRGASLPPPRKARSAGALNFAAARELLPGALADRVRQRLPAFD